MGIPAAPYFQTRTLSAPSHRGTALRRLARLHAEYTEAAAHARLLARTPLAAAVLIIGCALVTEIEASVVSPMLALWVLLNLAGAIGLLVLARQTERSACDLAALRAFAVDLNAMLLYAGFAWGAGAFFALAPGPAVFGPEWFAAVGTLAMTWLLRARVPVMSFAVPATALPLAAAMLLGSGGVRSTGVLLMLGLVLTGSSLRAERRARHASSRLRPAS